MICKYCGKEFDPPKTSTAYRPRLHCGKAVCVRRYRAERQAADRARKAREAEREKRRAIITKAMDAPTPPAPQRVCLKCGRLFVPTPVRTRTCELCFGWNTNIENEYTAESIAWNPGVEVFRGLS